MQNVRNTGRKTRSRAAALAMLLTLFGCGGGGGDTITLTTDSEGVDPTVLEVPVAFIRRPLPESPPDLRDPLIFEPGARLIIRERSSATALDQDVTDRILALVAEEEQVPAEVLSIDIKGLESSFDGETLVFAARVVPEPVDANLENTSWNLWLLDVQSLEPRYLIPSRLKRNEGLESGGAQDIAPHFLPDDRIVFSSTRQVAEQSRQLNEGRAQIFSPLTEGGAGPAAVLHIYDPLARDAEFVQISFNRSHDLDPAVLSDGNIVFSRWDNTTTDHISVYRISPSGLGLSPLFGFDSQSSGTDGSDIVYSQPRELDDGRLISLLKPFSSATLGGAIALLESADFASAGQPLFSNQAQPGSGAPSAGQSPLTETEVRTDGLRSSGGQYASVYPLRDGTGRLLVSWSDCRLIEVNDSEEEPVATEPTPDEEMTTQRIIPCSLGDDDDVPAPPLYGAWLYDTATDTQRPVVLPEEGFWISEIIAAEPRDFPAIPALPDNFNPTLAQQNAGQVIISSVFDRDGEDVSPAGISAHRQPGTPAFTARPARFLRLVIPVPLPDPGVFEIPGFAYGVSRANGFREIIGYVPIEPDGSVSVTVPAGRAFSFSVLDANARRIGARHDYWLQVGAGEVLRCTGCHDDGSALPHGRLDSQPNSSNPGAIAIANGLGFPNTNIDALFATEMGLSMAETWDFHRPADNAPAPARQPTLAPNYIDEWTSPALTEEPAITGRDYDPDWEGIPPESPIVINNLDPGAPDRIVINYIDHIQPIWERTRALRLDGLGNSVDRCLGCHSSQGNAVVPAGQLDLEALPSEADADQARAYRELLSGDAEQWLDSNGNLADRQRLCTAFDEDGNLLTFTETLSIGSSMRAGSANNSRFFACFEGGSCGLGPAPPLPDNCTEDGTPIPRTQNTVDHDGLLSEAELRLLSEWVDIGAQYYNNPFDSRLVAE
ncbi:MAG: hypothetical protein AAGI24_10085 [Pseudomonadota bacterium]